MFLPPDNHDRAILDVKLSWHHQLLSANTSVFFWLTEGEGRREKSLTFTLPLRIIYVLYFPYKLGIIFCSSAELLACYKVNVLDNVHSRQGCGAVYFLPPPKKAIIRNYPLPCIIISSSLVYDPQDFMLLQLTAPSYQIC